MPGVVTLPGEWVSGKPAAQHGQRSGSKWGLVEPGAQLTAHGTHFHGRDSCDLQLFPKCPLLK